MTSDLDLVTNNSRVIDVVGQYVYLLAQPVLVRLHEETGDAWNAAALACNHDGLIL